MFCLRVLSFDCFFAHGIPESCRCFNIGIVAFILIECFGLQIDGSAWGAVAANIIFRKPENQDAHASFDVHPKIEIDCGEIPRGVAVEPDASLNSSVGVKRCKSEHGSDADAPECEACEVGEESADGADAFHASMPISELVMFLKAKDSQIASLSEECAKIRKSVNAIKKPDRKVSKNLYAVRAAHRKRKQLLKQHTASTLKKTTRNCLYGAGTYLGS